MPAMAPSGTGWLGTGMSLRRRIVVLLPGVHQRIVLASRREERARERAGRKLVGEFS